MIAPVHTFPVSLIHYHFPKLKTSFCWHQLPSCLQCYIHCLKSGPLLMRYITNGWTDEWMNESFWIVNLISCEIAEKEQHQFFQLHSTSLSSINLALGIFWIILNETLFKNLGLFLNGYIMVSKRLGSWESMWKSSVCNKHRGIVGLCSHVDLPCFSSVCPLVLSNSLSTLMYSITQLIF